jgi:prefoldin subunit 5
VELGTGYFCEKEVPEAAKLIDRKVGVFARLNRTCIS